MILTGFNIPISEDLLIVLGGVWSASFVPHKAIHIWLCLFIGAYLADMVAYWTGRLLGKKLLVWRFFKDIITEQRLEKIHKFYDKYGLFSFLIGRFIPFGVRNCLFISAGMGKMTFKRFLLIDGIASFVSTSVGFSIIYFLDRRYHFGKHLQDLLDYISGYDKVLIIIVAGCAAIFGTIFFIRHKLKKKIRNKQQEKPLPIEAHQFNSVSDDL